MNRTALSLACALSIVGALNAQNRPTPPQADSPEPTIRGLVLAIYGNDVASYNNLTLPHPLKARLTTGGTVNASKLRQLREDPGGLQMRLERPLLFQGKEATLDANGQYPVGTSALYMIAHGGQPMIVGLQRRPEGWRVDVRWWIAMTDKMSGRGSAPGSPDMAVRSLLTAMLHLDRSHAARLITDNKQLDLLFDGAPRQREPSGVLEATVEEMPLVEIEKGEFYPMPGHIVEGGSTAARKVLVGWFGPVEIAFVLRRMGSDWKLEAEPFFALMER